ncbi:MAG: Rho termination factor N-terminal domain-containing protein [Thermodesulfobacteriota bacterium]|nr:Rho termination factor N-terminal domain-containing protein [Thermodesulfobacteriota bacterium]
MEKNLEDMTVTRLREKAKEYPQIAGVHAMKKAELIEAILEASGQSNTGEIKPIKESKSLKNTKKEIRILMAKRDEYIANRQKKELKSIRNKIKELKRTSRRLGKLAGRSS